MKNIVVEAEKLKLKIKILEFFLANDEYYYNYSDIERSTGASKELIKPIIKELKNANMVEYARGLMNDDGEVCGSGFGLTTGATRYSVREWLVKLKEMDKDNTEEQESKTIGFGDYVMIEQFRFGIDNEMYSYKVINSLKSNTWVDVPVKMSDKEVWHDHMEEVVSCICCGIEEKEVLKFRLKDVKLVDRNTY